MAISWADGVSMVESGHSVHRKPMRGAGHRWRCSHGGKRRKDKGSEGETCHGDRRQTEPFTQPSAQRPSSCNTVAQQLYGYEEFLAKDLWTSIASFLRGWTKMTSCRLSPWNRAWCSPSSNTCPSFSHVLLLK